MYYVLPRCGDGGGDVTSDLSMLKCCFTSTETVGLLGTGAQDVQLDFHTADEDEAELHVLGYLLTY